MNAIYSKWAVLLLFSTTFLFGNSQNVLDTPSLNRSMLKYFSGVELQEIAVENPQKMTELVYYFTQSFDVEFVNCASCPIDYHIFFNRDLFNIYEHENKRLNNDAFEFVYRDIYKITLKGSLVMMSNLNGSTPTDLVNYISPRVFPSWEEMGDVNIAYTTYKEKVYAWAKDYPEAYRTMTNSPDLVKVSIVVFRNLTEERKQYIMNSPNGYLIID